MQRSAANICRFLLQTPAFRRSIGRTSTLDDQLEAMAEQDMQQAAQNGLPLTLRDGTAIDIAAIDNGYRRTTAFRVTAAEGGSYTLHLRCRAMPGNSPLAQIPVSVFAGRAFLKTMTITGASLTGAIFCRPWPALEHRETSLPAVLFWPERHGTGRCYIEKMRTASRSGRELRLMKLDSIKLPKQKSVRGGWFLSYILVLIVPLLLCLLLYNYSAGIITAESKRIYGSALDQARIDLDSYLTEIKQTLSRTMQDQAVQRMVTTKKPLDGYDQLALVNTQSALLTIEAGHPNVTNVWVSLNNLDSVISSWGYLDQHLFYLSRFKNSSMSEDAWHELLHESHPRWEMVQLENEGGTDFLFIRSALTSGLSYADATVVVTVNKDLFVKRLQQFCWDPELDFYVLAADGTAICKTAAGDPPAMDIVQAAADGSFAFGSGGQQAT